jgi:hypothetical protein
LRQLTLIWTILAIPLPILLPPIPGLTPRLGPALAPTAVLVVLAAGGLLAGGTTDLAAPTRLAPAVAVVVVLAVLLVEAANELPAWVDGAGALPEPEDVLVLAFLVVGTKPLGFLGPAVD